MKLVERKDSFWWWGLLLIDLSGWDCTGWKHFSFNSATLPASAGAHVRSRWGWIIMTTIRAIIHRTVFVFAWRESGVFVKMLGDVVSCYDIPSLKIKISLKFQKYSMGPEFQGGIWCRKGLGSKGQLKSDLYIYIHVHIYIYTYLGFALSIKVLSKKALNWSYSDMVLCHDLFEIKPNGPHYMPTSGLKTHHHRCSDQILLPWQGVSQC